MEGTARFLQEFVDEWLGGDVDRLVDFPLSALRGDRRFGCPGRTFDADDTEVCRHMYMLLFGDVWQGMSMDSLKGGVFRGDTLNTYNTLFGMPNDLSLHPGLDRYEVSDILKREVGLFNTSFSFIGNMLVLPNLRVNRDSINTYRGKHARWRDYFDRFLGALRDVLTDNEPKDAGLVNLISANSVYFERYKGYKGFRELVDNLMLADYVDADYNPIFSSKGFYFWKKGLSAEAYEAEASRYINFATSVIEHRGAQMIKRLKKYLN